MQKSCINYYLQYHTINTNNIHLIVLLMYAKVSNWLGFPSPNLPVLHFYSQVKTEFPSWSFSVAPCLTPFKMKDYVSFSFLPQFNSVNDFGFCLPFAIFYMLSAICLCSNSYKCLWLDIFGIICNIKVYQGIYGIEN